MLKRSGLSRLPANCRKRSIISKRYGKQVPGHHVQVDVKFLQFKKAEGRAVKRYQFTAIDDATRIRALKIYEGHNQENAIDFIDHVISRLPFRIDTIRTDRGHEFQAKFHRHVEDLGMCHIYIRPRSPNLNGKVERSHSTGELEFYQLLTYTDDVDLRKKLAEWEDFYNVHRVWSVKGAAYRQGISLRRPGDARGHVLGQPSTMSLAAQLRQAMATASDLRRTPPRLAGCVSLPGVRAPTDPGRTLRPVWFVPDQAPPEALSGDRGDLEAIGGRLDEILETYGRELDLPGRLQKARQRRKRRRDTAARS